MPAAAFKLESAPGILANCLEQSQKTVSNHRKNINITYKLFQQCATVVERGSSGKIKKLTGEIAFITTLKENGINRLLVVKRGITEADRIIKFICGFIAHATEQQQARQEANTGESSEAALTDNAASRLTSNILRHLLEGFSAKDKNVRFRSVQFVATLINGLGELDDSDYESLLENLLERVKDKEPSIRVQAVYALAKLQNPDELNDGSLDISNPENGEDDDDEKEPTPTKVLLDIMRYDPAAEVRRAAMCNLDLHPTTLPYILSRSRDVDPINRRVIYAQSLAELPNMAVLSPEQRNIIAKSGLRDREDSVRKSAAKLIGKWAGNMEGGLLEFVGLFNVLRDTKIAEDAINSVLETRQDLAMALQFPETYWTDLSPESAVVAKLYIAYCKAVNDEARLEDCLPVITALAFRIQESYAVLTALHDQMQAVIEEAKQLEEEPEIEEGLARDFESTCFVTRQLLEIALMADYGDEIGRRKMFTLIRDMISDARLPADLVPTSMDVLFKLSSGERDFMRVIVEVVQNVHDATLLERAESAVPSEQDGEQNGEEDEDDDEDDLDLDTATPEDIQAAHRRKLMKSAERFNNKLKEPEKQETSLRCLDLVRALLERVAGSLQDNATLIGLVHELIVPSVKSKEPEIREQGLICLGLCTLLDKEMALDSFGLFIHQSQATEGELQVKIYQILFDVLMLYGVSFLEPKGYGPDIVVDFLLHALNQDSQDVQAIAAVGISKLMLSGMLTDAEVLKRLVLVYFAPETVDNLELRQCLSYFFPVYCYSLATNQKKMQEIFIPTFEILSSVYDELDDPSMMVTPTQLANQLLDWTDPRKAVAMEGLVIDQTIQAELAQDLLKKIYQERKKETRKLFCQLLNKLYLPDTMDEWTVKKLMLLIEQLDNHRPIQDTVTKNALSKFTSSLNKQFEEATRPMTEDEFRAFDQLHGVVDFLDAIKQENEERGGDDGSQAGNDSVATTSTTRGKRRGSATPRGSASSKKTPARRSRSISETPSVEDDDDNTPAPTAGSERRSARQPKPAVRKPQPIIEEEEEDSDDDDDDNEEEEVDSSSEEEEERTPAPVAPPAVRAQPQAQAKQRKSKVTPPPAVSDSDEATDDTL